MPKGLKSLTPRHCAAALLILAGLAGLLVWLWPLLGNGPAPFETVSPSPFTLADEPPGDRLFITGERRRFQSGDLRLVIPKLELDLLIQSGVDEDSLARGPGLYDYAQLPGTGNRNVSIAGHRDVGGSPFYYIDTLGENDYLYLVWQGTVYRYTYRDTAIVADDDWGPIYSQGISCLTLTSCDPIGTTLNRIVVRAELSERTPYTQRYEFIPSYQP